MEVVIDQKGEETVIKIKGRLDTNTAPRSGGKGCAGGACRGTPTPPAAPPPF